MFEAGVRSRLPIVLEEAKADLHEVQDRSAKLAASVARKRRMLEAGVRSRVPIVLEQAKAHLHEVHDRSTKLAASVGDRQRRLEEALRLKENNLRASFAEALDRGVETSRKIWRYETQFPERAQVRLRQVQNKFVGLVESVVDKPRQLRPRENDLQNLLSSSQDAVVVTSVDHRFVAANPKALSLFGISERNMKMFTIDAFLSRGQIPLFDEIGASFTSGKERCGECVIRRLDGSSGVAEYSFVANYVPFLHVCRFHNYRKWTLRRRLATS
jgi:PAS domain-containing protein